MVNAIVAAIASDRRSILRRGSKGDRGCCQISQTGPNFTEHNKTPVHALLRQQELLARKMVRRFPHYGEANPIAY
jgi:hypothetical protein